MTWILFAHSFVCFQTNGESFTRRVAALNAQLTETLADREQLQQTLDMTDIANRV